MLYRVEAEDQLTKPDLHLYIARGNLVALQGCLERDRERIIEFHLIWFTSGGHELAPKTPHP